MYLTEISKHPNKYLIATDKDIILKIHSRFPKNISNIPINFYPHTNTTLAWFFTPLPVVFLTRGVSPKVAQAVGVRFDSIVQITVDNDLFSINVDNPTSFLSTEGHDFSGTTFNVVCFSYFVQTSGCQKLFILIGDKSLHYV